MSSELSAGGEVRKREMLRELQGAMARRNGARVLKRAGGAVAVAAVVVWVSMPPRGMSGPRLPEVVRGERLSMTAMVATEEGIAERLTAREPERLVRTISDGELRALLAGTGDQAGLVRTGGRVILASEIEEKEAEKNTSDSTS